jgi:uncharacterized repeat protein (TIGR03847 family)
MTHFDDDNIHPVNRITAGAVGEPGRRSFVLQAQIGQELVSWVMEKDQVVALCQSISQLLNEIQSEFPELNAPLVAHEPELALREPLEPVFRIGSIGLGYDRFHDVVVLTLVDAALFDVGFEDIADEELAAAELYIYTTRGQALLLSQQTEDVVAAGRPLCPGCGKPIDEFGHFCFATAGHTGPNREFVQ